MKTFAKLLAWALALAVLVVVLAAVIVPLYVDPNDFKATIAREVERRVGRPVSLQGDIELSVFPWLGLQVGKVSVGNASGFADPTFASVEEADVRVKLLPLLRREVEMDTVTVRGLDLRLVRDKTGRANWDDLVVGREKGAGAAPAGTAPAGPSLAALAVGGIDLRNARLTWVDEASGQRLTVEDLDLKTGAILPGHPVSLDLTFRLVAGDPQVTSDLSLQGRLDADPPRGQYRLREVLVEARIKGADLPEEGVALALRGQADADLPQRTVKAVPLRLATLGLEAEMAVMLEDIGPDVRYSAALDTREFDLRALLERLTGRPPTTADPTALGRASLGTRIAGTRRSASANPLVLRIDDSTLEGQVDITAFEGPAGRFDLLVNRLDLDRYLAPRDGAEPAGGAGPADAGPAPAGPAAATAAAAGLPLGWLRGIDLKGRVRVDELKASRLHLRDVQASLEAKDGVLRIDPAEAQLYQGTYSGRWRLDARGATPQVRLEEHLTGIQAGPLLDDLLGKAPLTGRADVTLRVELAGVDADTALRSMAGDGRFSVREGAVRGVNLGRLIRQARAAIAGRPPVVEEGPAETDFSELHGTARIAGGVVRNEDLYAKSPLLRVEGKGSADLVQQRVDYLATAFMVGSPEGQGGKELEELKGVPIPVRVTGPFGQLAYRVELDEVLKAKAKDEARQRVEETIDKKLGGEAGEKAKELLRGLFR